MRVDKDIADYKSPYTVVIYDMDDRYYYADFIDAESMEVYAVLPELGKAKALADAIFVIKNYKWESLEAMNEVDGGYDVRIFDGRYSCVYVAHETFKEKWIGQ